MSWEAFRIVSSPSTSLVFLWGYYQAFWWWSLSWTWMYGLWLRLPHSLSLALSIWSDLGWGCRSSIWKWKCRGARLRLGEVCQLIIMILKYLPLENPPIKSSMLYSKLLRPGRLCYGNRMPWVLRLWFLAHGNTRWDDNGFSLFVFSHLFWTFPLLIKKCHAYKIKSLW